MNCTNCGTPVAPGYTFCTRCGAPVVAAPAVAPVSKKEYLANIAGPRTKQASKLILITMAVSLVLIIISVFMVLNASIFEIPLLSIALDATGEDPQEEFSDNIKGIKKNLKNVTVEKGSDEEELVADFEQIIDGLDDALSINNIKKLLNFADKHEDDLSDYVDYSELDTIDELRESLNIFSVGAWIPFLLPLLLALLAGLTKSSGLTIVALIFTLIPVSLLVSFAMCLLCAAVYIVQILLCNKLKNSYRNYQRTGVTA